MTARRRVVLAAAVLAAAALAGTGIARAAGGDDAEAPITGSAADQAAIAALAHTGGGRVTDTEVGDEDSLYEVEVTLDDGRRVDVQLDERFTVVGSEGDEANDSD